MRLTNVVLVVHYYVLVHSHSVLVHSHYAAHEVDSDGPRCCCEGTMCSDMIHQNRPTLSLLRPIFHYLLFEIFIVIYYYLKYYHLSFHNFIYGSYQNAP